jgi:hypothetical protein
LKQCNLKGNAKGTSSGSNVFLAVITEDRGAGSTFNRENGYSNHMRQMLRREPRFDRFSDIARVNKKNILKP